MPRLSTLRNNPARKKILCIWGTRPEAIKMAPVIFELGKRPREFTVRTCVTAQHREMIDQTLLSFKLRPHYDLNLMKPDQKLEETAGRVLTSIAGIIKIERPGLVLVQGDTVTAFASALAAFYQKAPVGHIEAGLRSHNRFHPYPEEINRVLADRLADIFFAPTPNAGRNLRREGVPEKKIFVTGNTVVDALKDISRNSRGAKNSAIRRIFRAGGRKTLLVTVHRRESFGKPMKSIFRGLLRIVEKHGDVEILYPVHPNPSVRNLAHSILKHPRIHLFKPLEYRDFLFAMSKCHFILTDSGGIQEEAPSFKKPVVVLREATERPELLKCGAGRLAGTAEDKIYRIAHDILTKPSLYNSMAKTPNPFGDGRAAFRIAEAIRHYFRIRKNRPPGWRPPTPCAS